MDLGWKRKFHFYKQSKSTRKVVFSMSFLFLEVTWAAWISSSSSLKFPQVPKSKMTFSWWVATDTEQTTALCSVCQHPASIRLKFCRTPPLLAFEFSAQPTISIVHTFSVRLENRVQNYSLAAVIYYSHEHFTTQIITRDGRVWFYDGMLITPTVPTLNCVGSINDPSFSLQVCRGGTPCAALYYCL